MNGQFAGQLCVFTGINLFKQLMVGEVITISEFKVNRALSNKTITASQILGIAS